MLCSSTCARRRTWCSWSWGRGCARQGQAHRHALWDGIVERAHPLLLLARKFLGSRPFSRANAALREQGQAEIDWSLPSRTLAPWAFVLATSSAHAPQDDERPALSILCPAAWIELARPLAEARSKQLALELTALEDVLASSSEGDAPERIKRHLFEAWRTRRVRYALLVGDSDVFPVRFMALDRFTPAAANFAFYACDLYYADVARADGSFDDWNAHREGPFARYFGEVRGEALKSDPINMDVISTCPSWPWAVFRSRRPKSCTPSSPRL